jgi:hypothetical protein
VVHGDVEGASGVRRAISDWLRFMDLRPAGGMAELDRYIGYFEPYATSHDSLDRDTAMQEEVRNAARTLWRPSPPGAGTSAHRRTDPLATSDPRPTVRRA